MDPKQNQLEHDRLAQASTEDIRSGIRNTRGEMDETLNELGERLHPRNLLEDVFDYFRGGAKGGALTRTSKRAARGIMHEVKEHPLPALLVGAGIAWWIIDAASDDDDLDDYRFESDGDGRRRRRAVATRDYTRDPDNGDGDYAGRASQYGLEPEYGAGYAGREDDSSTGEKLSGAAATAKEKAARAASAVGDTVSDAASAVGDKFSEAGEAAQSALRSGKEKVRAGTRTARRYSSSISRSTGRGIDAAEERLREASDEYPLAVGGACLAAGLLVGLLLPRTEQEDEWMGEASDEIKDEARAKGEEALERGKSAAAETANAAMQEAESRGLTPDKLAEKAKNVVAGAVAAAKDTAEKEGLGASDLKEKAKAVAERAQETVERETQGITPKTTP